MTFQKVFILIHFPVDYRGSATPYTEGTVIDEVLTKTIRLARRHFIDKSNDGDYDRHGNGAFKVTPGGTDFFNFID